MAQTSKPNGDAMNFFKNFKSPNVDFEAMMDMYRKNMEVYTKAQKACMETFRSMAEMNAAFMRKMMEEANGNVKSFMNAKTLEEKMQMGSQNLREGVEKALSHGKQVSEEWSKSMGKVSKDVSEHINKSMEEAKKAASSMKMN